MIGYVYEIIIGEDNYIGKTINSIDKRKYLHLKLLNEDKHFNKYLQKAYNEHKTFIINILKSVSGERFDLKRITTNIETTYIEEMNPTCNIHKSKRNKISKDGC